MDLGFDGLITHVPHPTLHLTPYHTLHPTPYTLHATLALMVAAFSSALLVAADEASSLASFSSFVSTYCCVTPAICFAYLCVCV